MYVRNDYFTFVPSSFDLFSQSCAVTVGPVHMQHHQDWWVQVLKNPIFQQIAPLVALFVVPLIIYISAVQVRQLNFNRVIYAINEILAMVFDSLGFSLPWLWGGPQKVSSSNSRIRKHRRKSSSAKVVRTRADQIALQKAPKQPIP